MSSNSLASKSAVIDGKPKMFLCHYYHNTSQIDYLFKICAPESLMLADKVSKHYLVGIDVYKIILLR